MRDDFAKFTAFNKSFLWRHLIPVRCKVRLFECDVKYLPPSAIRNWSHTPPDRMNRRSDLDKLKVKRNLIFFYFELQNAFLTLNEASDNKNFFSVKIQKLYHPNCFALFSIFFEDVVEAKEESRFALEYTNLQVGVWRLSFGKIKYS